MATRKQRRAMRVTAKRKPRHTQSSRWLRTTSDARASSFAARRRPTRTWTWRRRCRRSSKKVWSLTSRTMSRWAASTTRRKEKKAALCAERRRPKCKWPTCSRSSTNMRPSKRRSEYERAAQKSRMFKTRRRSSQSVTKCSRQEYAHFLVFFNAKKTFNF